MIQINDYIDNDPNGIVKSNLRFSPVTAYVVPRSLFSRAKDIEGIQNPGVYFLVGENTKSTIPEMYIGETSKGINRIFHHDKHKDFWGKAILFLAEAKHFDQVFINYLEEFLIEKAYEANRYKLHNGQVPKVNKNASDLSYINQIYDEIKFVMGSFGFSLENSLEKEQKTTIFKTSRRGIEAKGYYLGDSFEVLEGSIIDFSNPSKLEKYNEMRTNLLSEGDIELLETKYILRKTISFKTPSGASDFVLGGSTNGWREWKDINGKTLDELFRK